MTLNQRPRIVIIGTTSRIDSIDNSLRRPGRFDKEIEFQIPGPLQRAEIIKTLLNSTNHSLNDVEIENIASTAHGYVGSDLNAIVKEAAIECLHRNMKSANIDLESINFLELTIEYMDMKNGMAKVKPSSIREVVVQVPNVKWSDIGGQESIKQRLQEAISLPLLVQFSNSETRVIQKIQNQTTKRIATLRPSWM